VHSTGTGAPAPSRAWYAASVSESARDLEVDPQVGLSAAEAGRRLADAGPNQLAEAPREPRWRAFLRQFQDLMIIILLVAAVVSLLVSREWETPIAIALVVVLNATIGFVQESGRRPRSRRCGG
jgi:Ca2+-transporting ATPase